MSRYVLAVAANSFDKVSETFIRHHAKAVAPGRTVLLQRSNAPCPDPSEFGPCLRAYERLFARRGRPRSTLRAEIFLRRHRVKTILAEYGANGIALASLARRTGIRLFVHFHGYDASRQLNDPRIVRLYRDLFVQASGVFVPSHYIGKRLEAIGCPPGKITVSPCGVDPAAFIPSRQVAGRLIAVGRFVEKKSPLSTLRAFRLACSSVSGLHLDMIGDGPLLAECRLFAMSEGIADRVTFHGAQPHGAVRELMRSAMVFVQHSVTAADGDSEGMPVAILEAMSASIPIVSTLHSGIPEAVENGVCGFLVPEHDIGGMADAIMKLTQDPALARKMGAAGRERVESCFTAERTAQILRETMGI